jgi:hypothetical protein
MSASANFYRPRPESAGEMVQPFQNLAMKPQDPAWPETKWLAFRVTSLVYHRIEEIDLKKGVRNVLARLLFRVSDDLVRERHTMALSVVVAPIAHAFAGSAESPPGL